MTEQGNVTAGVFPNLDLEDQLCLALCRSARAITRIYSERLDALGITHPQYLVLLALYAEDGLCAGTIAGRVSLDPSSVTPILKKMENACLISRERPAGNQRQIRVRLTADGAALKPALADIQHQVTQITGLSHTELGKLSVQLRKIAERLDGTGGADELDSARA